MRAVAVVLFVTTLRGLPHFAQDDFACVAVVQASAAGQPAAGQPAAGLSADEASPHREHCAICHWTRSLRSPSRTPGMAFAQAAPTHPVHAIAIVSRPVPVLDQLPARAPPTVLL